jgi:hypothetical protein
MFKPTTRNGSLHETSSDNVVKLGKFATCKNLIVKRTMFPHCNINKFTWTSLDGKTHNYINRIAVANLFKPRIVEVEK